MANNLPFTGERFLPRMDSPPIACEHWHRYLYASGFVQDKTVLDVACGEGYGSFLLSRKAEKVVGVDIDRQIVRHASEKYASQFPDKVSFAVGPCNRIPINSAHSFDVIVSFETIEHLSKAHQRDFLNEVKRLIKRTGLFIISTPDELHHSDLPKTHNEFRRNQLYVQEFEALLASHFTHCVLLYQSMMAGSYLWKASDASNDTRGHGIGFSKEGFTPTDTGMHPSYIVALCSDAELPESQASLLADPGQRLVGYKENQLKALIESRSWRLTKPLRRVAAALRKLYKPAHLSESRGSCTELRAIPDCSHSGLNRAMTSIRQWLHQGLIRQRRRFERLIHKAGQASSLALKNPARVGKGIVYFARNGLNATLDRSRQIVSSEAILQVAPRMVDKKDASIIPILTTLHGTFVARLLLRCLNNVGIPAQIIYRKPATGFAPGLHFVVCAQMFDELPLHYVAFQMEQTVSPRWFGKGYLEKLNGSFAIFDYSLTNIKFLQTQGLRQRHIFYVPLSSLPGCDHDHAETEEHEYDVLFYGDVNDRRHRFINAIAARYHIKVLTEVYGDDLYAELRKAKVIVNIHYYPDALLETPRIYECLSYGCLVVSEKSTDFDDHLALDGIVDFFERDDSEELLRKIHYWLSDDERRARKIESNRKAIQKLPNWFEYYFLRFLLSSDNIDFDTFYNLASQHIRFDGNRICLGLPEAVERRLAFLNHNPIDFQYFPGLVHSLPWVGCGLSYKFIMRKALETGFEEIVVCEDDVEFPDGWQERFEIIQSYLSAQPTDWDVFAGLIAQLNEGTRVRKVETYKGTKFAHMDKMVSMVFNIYNRKFFGCIAQWDDRNRVVACNTIDRYIESLSSLRVITTSPFLVGHKEELLSTLWNRSNTYYTEMIRKSSVMLENKIMELESSSRRPT